MINAFFQRTEQEGQSRPMALDTGSIHPQQAVPEPVYFESKRVMLAYEEDSEDKKRTHNAPLPSATNTET